MELPFPEHVSGVGSPGGGRAMTDESEWLAKPVWRRYGGDTPRFLCVVRVERDTFDARRMREEYATSLIAQREGFQSLDGGTGEDFLDFMLFKIDPDCFLWLDRGRLAVIADRPERARDVLDKVRTQFRRRKRGQLKPVFQIIRVESFGMTATPVEATKPFIRKAGDLELHYGPTIIDFHTRLIDKMKRQHQGIAIMQGDPGTGKTTYIRALMWFLRRTHRFYTIPLSEFRRMTSSDCVSFWTDERANAGKQRLVLVIEDAEELIAGDGKDRNSEVATLLNLSDGLLGEYLQLQVIATVNCPLHSIDPAIIRDGRLMAHHTFRPLGVEAAARLAEHVGLALPEGPGPWTLAQLFNQGEPVVADGAEDRRLVGFGIG